MSDSWSRASPSVIFLCLIMTCIAGAIGGIAIGTLYEGALEEHKTRLADMVKKAAEIVDGIAQVEQQQKIVMATRSRIQESQAASPHSWLSETGELRIANSGGEEVTLLVGRWHPQAGQQDTPLRVEPLSEPMRRALAHESGVFAGRDHRGADVLAAYESLPELDIGLVAAIDLREIRAPFVRAGSVVAGIAVMMIAFGAYLFFAISDPIMARIREGEARFRELFDNMRSGAAIVEAGSDGRQFVLKDLNRAGERIDKVRRDDVLGQRIEEALPLPSTHGLLEAVARVWRTSQPEHLPMQIGNEKRGNDDREPAWREQYIYRLPSREIVILYDDVSVQKRAEQVLRDSEARWRSIIEMQSIATLIVDKDNYIRFVNRAAETLFGHASGKLVDAPFGFPVTGSEVAEIEIVRSNGGVVYAEMQSIPIPWAGEQQFLLFIRDISAHRRAEGDLRKLFQAIEQSPVSVVITDLQGKIEYVNPKFTETTGYTYPEVVGKNPGLFKSGYTSAAEYATLWNTIGSGQVWRGEFQNRNKSGELFWEMASIAPVRDVHGKVTHYVCVKEDITERKGTEDRLRQAHKMHAIGELTGGIAHDFNNLLAIILGNLQLLEEELADDDDKRELISDAMWSAERGAELINRLLAFARRQRLNPKTTDLNHVVREMTDILRRTLGERIEIREVLAPTLVKTMIDRGQLENVLLNLTVNARDAMPKGGVLTIITENSQVTADEIGGEHGVKPGNYAVISVTDTGVGMPPDVVERIFEPFFTTKGFGKGSGLGLSMVYGFVNQSGGHITVDSKVGRGTTIKLYLPKAEPREVKQAAPATIEQGRGEGGVVMIVEGDDRLRKTAVKVLRKQGYHVIEAGSAPEALSLLEDARQVDLLVTDLVLPDGTNGQQLAQEVVRHRPHTRLLFTFGKMQNRLPPEDLPGANVLAKPYRGRALVRKVHEILSQHVDARETDEGPAGTPVRPVAEA
jgi:two-component system, cell cycle sensor histidine kinase and response regulator CckA